MAGTGEPRSTEGPSGSATALAALTRTLDTVGIGAYVSDEQGGILAVNARGVELLQRPVSEMVGHDAHDLLHRTGNGESVPRTQCQIQERAHTGEVGQGTDLRFERGDGTLLAVSWLVTPCVLGVGRTVPLVLFYPGGQVAEPVDAVGSLTELERLALLAETTTLLTSTLDVNEAVRRLVGLVLPRLADWVVIDLIGERDEVQRFVVAHAENGTVVYREDLQGPMPPVPEESPMPLSRALRGVASSFAGPETYQGPPDSGIAVEQRRLFAATGMHSAVVVPIRSVRNVLGSVTLGRADQPAKFSGPDAVLLEDIARRAALALENARLYQRQLKVAETMQRHLLPHLPQVPGADMTARYLPAPDASQVGGDWYDAFMLTETAAALVIGDVVGHDLDAAAGMSQLRNMLRAYAWAQQEPPSKVVEWLGNAAVHIAEVSMATLIFARLTRNETGRWELFWTNAGHPPPLLITHEGIVRTLDEGHGILLGVTTEQQARCDATEELPPGATLLFYTDGLIESPSHSLDEGLDRLRRYASALVHRPLERFADELLEKTRPPDNDDDVALLAVRIPRNSPEGAPGREGRQDRPGPRAGFGEGGRR